MTPQSVGGKRFKQPKKASNALSLGESSLAFLVGSMLIQLSHTEQFLEIRDSVSLSIRIA